MMKILSVKTVEKLLNTRHLQLTRQTKYKREALKYKLDLWVFVFCFILLSVVMENREGENVQIRLTSSG